MEIAHLLKKCGIDQAKKVYECSQCKKLFNWDNVLVWISTIRI